MIVLNTLATNMVTDKDILNYFVNSGGKIISSRINKINIETVPEFKEYLLNRYPDDDFISYSFTVKRILHNVETLPTCENCGKKLYRIKGRWCNTKCQLTDKKFISYRERVVDKELQVKHFHETCFVKYGVSAPAKNKEIYDKVKKTNKEKYGNECVFRSEYGRKKSEKTCLERYGVTNGGASKEAQEKIRKTKLERYGDEYYTNSELAQETCLKRYGVRFYLSYDGFIEQSKNTKLKKYGDVSYNNPNKNTQSCLEHYGVDNYFKTQECKNKLNTNETKQKRYETKKKNGTMNTSGPEENCYQLLLEKYPDVIRYYKSKEYPFNCDFYIPSIKLYIEYQGNWTHGKHPFNENNPDDILKYNEWKSKHSEYYDNAAYDWRYRDTNKRQIVKQNNLNFIEFWNLDEVNTWLNNNQL